MSLTAICCAIGLHIASHHFPERDYQQNRNIGIYLRSDNWQIGTYRNTINRQSYYAAKSIEIGAGFEIMGGVVSGYQRRGGMGYSPGALTPLIGITYAAPKILGVTPRVWLIPPAPHNSTVLHLSLEY